MTRNQGVIEPLLELIDEMNKEREAPQNGPTFSDVIFAKLLAQSIKELPVDRMGKRRVLKELLEKKPKIETWLRTLLNTNVGRRNLKALLRREGIPLV